MKNELLEHYLTRRIKPDLDFRFQEIIFRSKRIVVLIIPSAKDVPTSFDENRYCCIGSSKVNLMDYPEQEAELFVVLRDGIPMIDKTAFNYQDLTFNKLFGYYGSEERQMHQSMHQSMHQLKRTMYQSGIYRLRLMKR